jgi:hypothetical protein
MSGRGQYHFGKREYKGDFLNGKFHGEGQLTYSNEDKYSGSFRYNKKHGFGRMMFSNGNAY